MRPAPPAWQVYLWGVLAPGEGTAGQLMEVSEPMQHVLEERGGVVPITLMQTFRWATAAGLRRRRHAAQLCMC